MTIEDFSNEFFVKIFDYLDGCDIYYAFSHLNHRFEKLLNSPLVLFKINFDNCLSKEILIDIYKKMLILHKHQIFSIHSSTSLSMNRFLSFDSSFNHLQSLVLYEFQSDLFLLLLNNLSRLPCLFSLTLKMFKGLTDIYEITLNLPMLKYHNVSTNPSDLLVSVPVHIDQQFSLITHLIIENHCSFNNVLRIISYTPQLYHLNYTNTNSNDRTIEINSPIILSNFKSLSVCVYSTKFDIFEMFLRQIHSKLKVLSFVTRYEDISYLDANRWKEIILKYLSQLEEFHLQYYEEDSKTRVYCGKANQFTSLFWIKRQWIFDVQKNLENIVYSVRPYKYWAFLNKKINSFILSRKRWDEFIEDEMHDFSFELSKSTELTFLYMNPNEWRDVINVNIKRILSITQIYHLTISVEKTFIGVLIVILNSLPKLHSFKLHSLSCSDPKDMNPRDYDIFFSTKPTNKIKKVYLEKLNQPEEIYFLRTLCPHMVYLKVDWIKGQMNTVPYQRICFE